MSRRRAMGPLRHLRAGAAWLGLLVALPLTACGGSSNHKLSGPVLTEVVGGGFVPADAMFVEQLPDVAVFADGRIFTVNQASASLGSKSALVMPVERTLPASTLDQIANLAQEAGVTRHPPDVGRPDVTDLATTTFTLSADGKTSTVLDIHLTGVE